MDSNLTRRRLFASAVTAVFCFGCAPKDFFDHSDKAATQIIAQKQQEAFATTQPFTIERPEDTLRRRLLLDQNLPTRNTASYGSVHAPTTEHWPEHLPSGVAVPPGANPPTTQPIVLSLEEALKVAAYNSRAYQNQKELIYVEALNLDLERDAFRRTWSGLMAAEIRSDLGDDQETSGVVVSPALGWNRKFRNGAEMSAQLGFDLVKLLGSGGDTSNGLFFDASIFIPLLRGAGEFVVTEPLTQAERNVVYQLLDFDQYKRTFAVDVIQQYFQVLGAEQSLRNANDGYVRAVISSRRVRRLADAGRQTEVQYDQALQSELRARERWIISQTSLQRRLDDFKILLGLPPDAAVQLDSGELKRMNDYGKAYLERTESALPTTVPAADAQVILEPIDTINVGPLERDEREMIETAFDNRSDLLIAVGEVQDAQRKVAVAADALRAGLDLVGRANAGQRRSSLGSAVLPSGELRFEEGVYTLGLNLDMPFERTREQNAYRQTIIRFEQAVRAQQELEDRIKSAIRNDLRSLLQTRESFRTQSLAVTLAERRVASTNLNLEAGRAQVRDVLDAQDALVTAQNTRIQALIDYRVNEFNLQRDAGILTADNTGLVTEVINRAQQDAMLLNPATADAAAEAIRNETEQTIQNMSPISEPTAEVVQPPDDAVVNPDDTVVPPGDTMGESEVPAADVIEPNAANPAEGVGSAESAPADSADPVEPESAMEMDRVPQDTTQEIDRSTP